MRLLFAVICFWNLCIASLQDEVIAKIINVDLQKKQVVFEAQDLLIGENGWVKLKTQDYAGIIKEVEVIHRQGEKVIAKFKNFDALKQKYLPVPTNLPKVGDEVIFRTLNTKAFLVSPTLEIYDQIKTQRKEVEFLSPDLLMGYLLAYGGFDPTKDFFKKACNTYGVGLLYIVNEGAMDVLDCQSFVVLDSMKLDTSNIKDIKIPFYSRIDEIKTGTLFSFLHTKKSKYYFPYFTNLAHPERDYQTMMVAIHRENEKKIKQEKEEKKRLKVMQKNKEK